MSETRITPDAQSRFNYLLSQNPSFTDYLGSNDIRLTEFTCARCAIVASCTSAFDTYNLHGDCLEMK